MHVCVLLCINQSGCSYNGLHLHYIYTELLMYTPTYTYRELDEGTSFVALSYQYVQLLDHVMVF